MSWAEIKKALNTNLDVPLNELIEKVNYATSPDTYGCEIASGKLTAKSTHELLNVTGKGKLFGFHVSDYSGATTGVYTTLEIIIDGVSYELKACRIGNYNGYTCIYAINPSDIQNFVSGSNASTVWYAFGYMIPIGNIGNAYYNGSFKHIGHLQNVTFDSYNGHGGLWMQLNDFIPFEESLVIKVTTAGSDCMYGIGYQLYD